MSLGCKMSVITEVYFTRIGIFMVQFSKITNICCVISNEGIKVNLNSAVDTNFCICKTSWDG